MISNRLVLLTVLTVFALSSPALRAHDPYDITSQARVRAEGIELRLTLASSTARRLLTGKSGPIDRAQFDEFRADFERGAPQFLSLSAAKKALVPSHVAVELTDDGDLKILLHYPAVPATRFRLDATLLEKLPREGYTVFLLVRGPGEDDAGHERLTQENPHCDLPAFRR